MSGNIPSHLYRIAPHQQVKAVGRYVPRLRLQYSDRCPRAGEYVQEALNHLADKTEVEVRCVASGRFCGAACSGKAMAGSAPGAEPPQSRRSA